MTDHKKRFAESIPDEDRHLYSLNFLLAGYEPIADLKRDEALIENKQPSRQYGTRDFADSRFYKQITTPLSQLGAAQHDDE